MERGEVKTLFRKQAELAAVPMTDDRETRRVEIIMLKFKEPPEIMTKSVMRIIHNTDWPFKFTIFDNRLNSANTSRIWNKLVRESTCDYVLIIDSDAFIPGDKLKPCWLTRMMESIEQTGVVVPVGTNIGCIQQCRFQPADYGTAVSTEINKREWSGFCFLFKKEILKKTGMFDERFYIYGQDGEFAFRTNKIIGGAVQRNDVFIKHMSGYSFKKEEEAGNIDRRADKIYARQLYHFLTGTTPESLQSKK